MKVRTVFAAPVLLLLACGTALAQPVASPQPAAATPPAPPPAYGMPMNGDQAQQAMTAAEREARQNGWSLSLAVVDTYGNLVMFKSMPGTGLHTGQIAIRKAKTAAMLRAPSKVFADMAARGSPMAQILPELVPLEGGVPIIVGGKIIGAVGASGATGAQDAQAAARGADAVS